MRMKMNSSHRHDINRPRPRHGYEYTKHKMCPSMMMVLCGKQHLSNEAEFMKKASISFLEPKKCCYCY